MYLKNNTRWHEGFKLLLCTFHVVMQIQANFTAIAKSIFYDFYWLFLCLTSLALFFYYGFDFLSRFLLETKESESINCMAIEKVQTAYIACEFPLYPGSKHGLSKNTLIFQTFGAAQNLHFLFF